MEFNPEKEPLLNKEDQEDTIIKIEDSKDKEKSKEQIIDCKEFLELICFCCYDYDVTKKEYEAHLALSNKCSVSYDQENPIHEKLLFDFFTGIQKIFKEETEEDYENLDNKILSKRKTKDYDENNALIKDFSKKIGFQSDNPRTDFKEGGFYSLEFMNCFINNYKTESKNILKEKDFLFALVCINLIYRINLILYLIDKDKSDSYIYNIYKIERCSRKEIKNFCMHLVNDNEKDLLFSLINLCLGYAFAKYKMKNSLNINLIIDDILMHFKEVLINVKNKEKLVDKLKNELEIEKLEKNKKIKEN